MGSIAAPRPVNDAWLAALSSGAHLLRRVKASRTSLFGSLRPFRERIAFAKTVQLAHSLL